LNVLIDTLEECRKYDLDITFNFISSWFVYGKGHKSPCSEDSYCNPTGFYSITKRAAEQMLISYCETYNIKYRILRLCNVIGLADKKASKKKNALQFMINSLLNDEPINLYEGGIHKRDYMHVDDVCRAIKTCIEKSGENEIVNIGTGKSIDIFTLINFCKTKINSQSQINNISTPEFHKVVQIENIYLNVDKLKSLGFDCDIDIFDRLEKMIEGQNGK
jgi:nucleoside-diphosphate-sugar epimerase